MGMKRLLQRLLFLPILGILFATSSFPLLSEPVYAIPEDGTSETTEVTEDDIDATEDTESEDEEETKSETEAESPSCFDVVGSMGWFICPLTTLATSAADALYDIIDDFLVIEPITFNEESAIYVVWAYARNITNIVFILFFLVIIFSQLTGVGFDNYGIKKTLPRIIISAILVNLSFLLCSLAVDTSNVIGASLRGFFNSVIEMVKANNVEVLGELSTGGVISQIFGTGAGLAGAAGIAVFAVGVSGGLGHFIWILIPVILGAVVSLLIGLFTIALRQAVVSLLVMISPLAFVAYLLPNTEKYFDKWFGYLKQMLFFYPMFSCLYGASQLAGWTLIANGATRGNVFEAIIGVAVQVFPLVLSFKLLKMSDTVLGKVNDALHKASEPGLKYFQDYASRRARLAAADYDKRFQTRQAPAYNPGRLRNFINQANAELDANVKKAEETRQKLLDEYVAAREINKDIKIDENGNRTFTEARKDRINSSMQHAMDLKDADLRLQARALERENALSQMSTYAKKEGIEAGDKTNVGRYINHQAQNYLDLETQTNAKRRNDLADKRFYAKSVLEAGKRDKDGNLENPDEYKALVLEGAGADAFDNDARVRNNAIGSVVANAYDVTEAERQNEIKHLTSFLDTQPTQRVEDNLDQAIASGDVNSIIAGVNILDKRGDVDLVAKHVREFMDSGKLKLGTEDANNLALAFLQHKGSPLIRRLGKYINVETLQYTSGHRGDNDTITFKEFITGKGDFETLNEKTGKMEIYTPKYDVISTLKGTALTDVERTAYQSILESMAAYSIPETNDKGEVTGDYMLTRIKQLDEQLRPQLVTAIPTYNSGSEQIMAAARYLTGLKPGEDGKWTTAKVEGPGGQLLEQLDPEVFLERTVNYLSAFTPDDLVKMKSDILGASQALFMQYYGNEQDARTAFKDIFMRNGTLSTLLSGDKQKVGAMKKGVRDWLDIEPSQIDETKKVADARAAEYEAWTKYKKANPQEAA